jgi:hypothetical protein
MLTALAVRFVSLAAAASEPPRSTASSVSNISIFISFP